MCLYRAIPCSPEGRTRRHERGAGMRWTVQRQQTSVVAADCKSVCSCPPDAGVKFLARRFAERRWLTSRYTGESTYKPLKPIAQGRPECFGGPVVTCLRGFFTCTQGCGCAKHPAFPAPSDFWGTTDDARLGQIVPRECEAVFSPRHCERSEAIQTVSAEKVWIASSRSLSSGRASRGPVGSSQ